MIGKRFLLIILALFLLYPVHAQESGNITMEFNSEKLSSALRRLEKASNYKILFIYDDVDKYLVNGKVVNATFEGALKFILRGKPFDYSIE